MSVTPEFTLPPPEYAPAHHRPWRIPVCTERAIIAAGECWIDWHHAAEVLAMYEADDAYRDTRDALAYRFDANGRYAGRRTA